MATPEDMPPYPTFEDLKAAHTVVKSAPNSGQLLFWPLNGPVETAVWVLTNPADPDEREPYYDQSTNTLHPVSKLPITEPKVSSMTVHVYDLQDWEDAWCAMHYEHADRDVPDDFDFIKWAMMDGSSRPQLVRCCGDDRPRMKDVTVVVRPAKMDGEDGGFVTVHDYLTTVHPWLLDMRPEILGAMGMYTGNGPLPPETDLAVNCDNPCSLRMGTRAEWIRDRKRKPIVRRAPRQ